MIGRLCFVLAFALFVSCGNNGHDSIDRFADYEESEHEEYDEDYIDEEDEDSIYEDDTYSEYDYGGLDGERLVYVCTGQYADAFHVDRDCDGLWNCSGEIIIVDVATAVVDMERHPCHFCVY